jgi:uncharacterized protein
MRTINELDWAGITAEMHTNGYAIVPSLLTPVECEIVKNDYDNISLYRKTVVMARHRFGQGEYKYFKYPLPDLIQMIRSQVYPPLAGIANAWFRALKIGVVFPAQHADFLAHCHEHSQQEATAFLLKYGKGGYNTLHQDLYGEVYFPIQVMLMLNEPEVDFSGGEFVLIQQIPRAQSKAIVLKPRKGDLVIFATNFRPQRSINGYFRVHMKHGVSEVTSGERHALGIVFHDAAK